MGVKSQILNILGNGPADFNTLHFGVRLYVSMTEEEAMLKIPDAIRELIAEGKIQATITATGVCYHLASKVPMESKDDEPKRRRSKEECSYDRLVREAREKLATAETDRIERAK